MDYTPVSPEEFAIAQAADTARLASWSYVENSLVGEFSAGTFTEAGSLVGAIAAASDEADHHPDVDLRYPDVVRVTLRSHATGGVSNHDVELARAVSTLAAG